MKPLFSGMILLSKETLSSCFLFTTLSKAPSTCVKNSTVKGKLHARILSLDVNCTLLQYHTKPLIFQSQNGMKGRGNAHRKEKREKGQEDRSGQYGR